ncbi:transporter substrate-binding domain-containing protein [Mesorhizobium sp. M3A.F.Ca.ET.201.01.1.1]|uniref:transporter substrate-binding domain-containing protein n=1 Tax=Mesorhizobium sp. M3A.F.Ca.ET.201.01.1.1 TaxID=2563946 RepID=UPI00109384F5|nr:transporter substrate-binding domain-containing protein [Mesorhizobium sp. M3A.F.Ca.ET.201.01.1.1]TGS71758.1 transporter substrate-binding domain-containing protein [Mesorhizobium sp. M3A.F.Ca.ET.201.01.1.1]
MTAFMKGIAIAAAVVGTILGHIGSSAAQAPAPIAEKGVLRVGMLVDFPPFGFINAQGEPDGFDADVANALAERMGVKLEIEQVTGPNRIPYLLTDKIDVVIASLGITDERKKQVAFTRPYAAMLNVIYGDKALKIGDPAGLAGHSVGVTRASVQETALLAVAPTEAKVQKYDDDASAVQALLSGQAEVIGVDTVTIEDIEKRAPAKYDIKFELSAQVQGIAVRPGSDQLLTYLNKFVDEMIASGKLDEIHRKWFHRPLPKAVSN